MARSPKMFLHGSVYELCFRTQDGLPLTSARYLKRIIKGCLAAAQTKYRVTICQYLVMPNHIHMIVKVDNPEDVCRFVLYFKRESSHAINRLMGRTNRTVWVERYFSPMILDLDKVIDRIVYILANPAKAGLVSSLSDYPNLSSWSALLNGDESTMCKRVPRAAIEPLPKRPLTEKEALALDQHLANKSVGKFYLTIEPFAWITAFASTANVDDIRKTIIARLQKLESSYAALRKTPPLGANKLISQSIFKEYVPTNFGNKMICLASSKALRVRFISFFKKQAKIARDAFKEIRSGGNVIFPPSFFQPGCFLLANLIPKVILDGIGIT